MKGGKHRRQMMSCVIVVVEYEGELWCTSYYLYQIRHCCHLCVFIICICFVCDIIILTSNSVQGTYMTI